MLMLWVVVEEMKWHNELVASMIEKGEKLNGEGTL